MIESLGEREGNDTVLITKIVNDSHLHDLDKRNPI